MQTQVFAGPEDKYEVLPKDVTKEGVDLTLEFIHKLTQLFVRPKECPGQGRSQYLYKNKSGNE
jgi:hypothetical protein